MNKFPENFKCVLWNKKVYFTHFYDAYIEYPQRKVHLKYIYSYTQDIENGSAYCTSETFKEYPNSDIKEVVKTHFRYNDSYKNHDFTKDTFEEIFFKDLPKKVQKIFRSFENHDGFKISEAVSFHIKNTF